MDNFHGNNKTDTLLSYSALAEADVVATTMPLLGTTADLAHKLCGRALNNAGGGGAAATVCSAAMPFRIGVNFDADEFADTTANDERFMDTGAIVGFKLAFKQK